MLAAAAAVVISGASERLYATFKEVVVVVEYQKAESASQQMDTILERATRTPRYIAKLIATIDETSVKSSGNSWK